MSSINEVLKLLQAAEKNKVDVNSLSSADLTDLIHKNFFYIKDLSEADKKIDKNIIRDIIKRLESLQSFGFNFVDAFISGRLNVSKEFFLELCEEGKVTGETVFTKTGDLDLALKIADRRNEFLREAFKEREYSIERIEEFLTGSISRKIQVDCLKGYLSSQASFEEYPVSRDILYAAMKKHAAFSMYMMSEACINKKELYFMLLDEHPELIKSSRYIRVSDLKKAMELNIPFTIREVGKVRHELDKETKLLLILNYDIPTSMFIDKEGREIGKLS